MNKRSKRTRANDAEIAARVQEIMLARLSGASFHDLELLATEREWNVSERQLWRYVQAADERLDKHFAEDRERLFRRHVLQRRRLFALALQDGDFRTALAVIESEAKLFDLLPDKKVQVSGKGGGPVTLHIVEEIIGRGKPADLEQIVEEVVSK